MFFFSISKQYILTADFLWTSTYYDSHVGRALMHLLWVLRRIPRGWDILAVRVFVWNEKKKACRTLIDVWIVNYMYQEQMTRNMERSFEFLCLPYWWKWSLHVRELVPSGSRFNEITEKHITGLTSQLLF